jgi:hypothetical protein
VWCIITGFAYDGYLLIKAICKENIKSNAILVDMYEREGFSKEEIDMEIDSVFGTSFDVKPSNFKHCRVRNTKLARKMYPNGKENGEWLYV